MSIGPSSEGSTPDAISPAFTSRSATASPLGVRLQWFAMCRESSHIRCSHVTSPASCRASSLLLRMSWFLEIEPRSSSCLVWPWALRYARISRTLLFLNRSAAPSRTVGSSVPVMGLTVSPQGSYLRRWTVHVYAPHHHSAERTAHWSA